MIVIAIIAIIAAIAIPDLEEARKHGNESSAIGVVRTIAEAQSISLANTGSYQTLAGLASDELVSASVGQGTRSGYYFDSNLNTATGSITHNAFPASPYSGSRNFQVRCDASGACDIRETESGIPDPTSPLVPESEGNPPDPIPVPPGGPGPTCPPAPPEIFPTTPAEQAAAAAALEEFFVGMVTGLAETYAPTAADMTQRLFFGDPNSVARFAALDTNGNGSQEFSDFELPTEGQLVAGAAASLLPGQFSAVSVIGGVNDAYGGCDSLCILSGLPASSCPVACSESVAPAGEVEGALENLAAGLPALLDLGIACEEDQPGVPFASITGDPFLFVTTAFGLSPGVPALPAPAIWLVIAGLAIAGGLPLRLARRSSGS